MRKTIKSNSRRRREQQIIKRVLIVLALVLVLGVSLMSCLHVKANKEYEASLREYNKEFTSYEIENGDTVSELFIKVCNEYPDTKAYNMYDWIAEVEDINHIHRNVIEADCFIILPYLTK